MHFGSSQVGMHFSLWEADAPCDAARRFFFCMLEIAKYVTQLEVGTCIRNIHFYIPMHTTICIPHMHVLGWGQPKALITSARVGGHDANSTNTTVSSALEFVLSSLPAASDE
jgi:hypothetical protein